MEIGVFLKKYKQQVLTVCLMVLFSSLALEKLAFYVQFDFNFALLIIAIPFAIRNSSKAISLRYGIVALILFGLYIFIKLNSLYFFAFVCSILFLYESQFGKLNSLILFLLIVASPVAIFLSEVLGFEIRLYLTRIAASVLSLVNKEYTAAGNIILMGEEEFHVDPECLGLKMVFLGLIICILFFSYFQKKNKKTYHPAYIILGLIISYILIVVSNLLRIILISFFRAYPGGFSHELIGLICFVVYVIFPLWYIVKALPGRNEKENVASYERPTKGNYYYVLLASLSIALLVFRFSSVGVKEDSVELQSSLSIQTEAYACSVEEFSVLKLSNDSVLIYIKPPASFYSADHTPIICWRGSGYKVQREDVLELNGFKLNYSELILGEDILYSTWWYDCGEDKTNSQFHWRWNNLINSKDYRLVNVISYDKNILYHKTNELISKNIFVKE